MLDCCCCFTRGGVLLWSFYFAELQGSPLNQLIEKVLLEERIASTCASIGGYCFQWFCLNSLQLIFVAAYRGVRHLALIDQLLQQTAQAFEHQLKSFHNVLDYPVAVAEAPNPFDNVFLSILSKSQQRRQEGIPEQEERKQQGIVKESKYAKRAKEKDSGQLPASPQYLQAPRFDKHALNVVQCIGNNPV